MKIFIALALSLISPLSLAEVYENTANGNTTYSDTPQSGGGPVSLPRLNTNISLPNNASSSSTPPTPSQLNNTPASQNSSSYKTLTITDPSEGETFQNQRDIPIKLQIDPTLKEGDKILIMVDGSNAGEPTADLNQVAIHNIDRGEHQVSVAVLSRTGTVLKQAGPITIYIHYSAIPTGSGAVKPAAGPAP